MPPNDVEEYNGFTIIKLASGLYFIMQGDYVRVGTALSRDEAYMIVDVLNAGRKLHGGAQE